MIIHLQSKHIQAFGLYPELIFVPKGTVIVTGEVGSTIDDFAFILKRSPKTSVVQFTKDANVVAFNRDNRTGEIVTLCLSYACTPREHELPQFAEPLRLQINRVALRSFDIPKITVPYGADFVAPYRNEVVVPDYDPSPEKPVKSSAWILPRTEADEALRLFKAQPENLFRQVWIQAISGYKSLGYDKITFHTQQPAVREPWYSRETGARTGVLRVQSLFRITYNLVTTAVEECYSFPNRCLVNSVVYDPKNKLAVEVGAFLPHTLILD